MVFKDNKTGNVATIFNITDRFEKVFFFFFSLAYIGLKGKTFSTYAQNEGQLIPLIWKKRYLPSTVFIALESFRFEDKNEYKYEI